MDKSEFIKLLENLSKKEYQKGSLEAMFAYDYVIQFAEQLDEPKECDVWQKENGDNVTKCGVNLSETWTFNFCPSCGSKIIKSE